MEEVARDHFRLMERVQMDKVSLEAAEVEAKRIVGRQIADRFGLHESEAAALREAKDPAAMVEIAEWQHLRRPAWTQDAPSLRARLVLGGDQHTTASTGDHGILVRFFETWRSTHPFVRGPENIVNAQLADAWPT